MYVYEVLDHQYKRTVGIYTNWSAAIRRVIELTGKDVSTRYKVWPMAVKDVIYEPELDCMIRDERDQDQFCDDLADINAIPF